MIDRLNLKELIMLYSFILESLYLASHPEGENTRLILSRHNLEIHNLRKDQQGKKPVRIMSLKNSEGQRVITFADLNLLKRQVERLIFHSLPEPITWDAGDHSVVIKPAENGVRLEIHSSNPVALTFSNPEVLKLLSANLLAYQTWNALHPVKTDALEIVKNPKGFAIMRVKLNNETCDYPLGKYPLLNLSIYATKMLED